MTGNKRNSDDSVSTSGDNELVSPPKRIYMSSNDELQMDGDDSLLLSLDLDSVVNDNMSSMENEHLWHSSEEISDETLMKATDSIMAGVSGPVDTAGEATVGHSSEKQPEEKRIPLSERIRRKLLENSSKAPTLRKSLGTDVNRMAAELVEKNIREMRYSPPKETFYGLPMKFVTLLEEYKGIKELYDWQKECLNLPAVKEKRNLLYSLPTSGGKTLVAEILMLKELLCYNRNVVFVLPYVSLVQEKVRFLSPFAVEFDFLVEEYAGGRGHFPPIRRRRKRSIYVATVEKSHGLINSLLEQQRAKEIGLIVVDEIHILSEGSGRGANLESMLTKVLFALDSTQIIGMSATVGNLSELAQFLRAELYVQNFRPVNLREYIKLEDEILEINTKSKCEESLLTHIRNISAAKGKPATSVPDSDGIGTLVAEVVPAHSCLVFCPSKKNCENVAMMLRGVVPKTLLQHKREKKEALYRALKHEGINSVCPILKKTLPYGVAYHHSGLTQDERKLIEEAYLDGTLCCICCTSTLAAGVNLPARRVILRTPYVGSSFLSTSRYNQMIGRAGRAGMDTCGESFLVCRPSDKNKVMDLLCSPVEKCTTTLHCEEQRGLQQLVLSAISLGIATQKEQLKKFLVCSLLSVQAECLALNTSELIQTTVDMLLKKSLIKLDEDNSLGSSGGETFTVTRLGKATVKGSIDLDRAGQLYKDLCNAQKGLVIKTRLHLLYLVTPYDMVEAVPMDSGVYLQKFLKLGPAEMQVAKMLGINEACLLSLHSGSFVKRSNEFVLQRFFVALMLYEIWNLKTVWDISEEFKVPRGTVQSLVASASAFGSCVYHFCQEFEEFWAFHDLFGKFTQRLAHCCRAELIPLMELPAVKMGRARQLYNAGYKSLSDLANSKAEDLVKVVEHLSRRIAHQIVAAARMKLVEKAEGLREEMEAIEQVLLMGHEVV